LRIGIMQGRLLPPDQGKFQSFPRAGWPRELELAAQAGLDCIEWIDDVHGEGANPLWQDGGIARMRELCARHGVAVRSLCADWFMENPLVRCSDDQRRARLDRLGRLISRCAEAGIGRIVMPFVDNSRIETETDVAQVVSALRESVPAARAAGVELHLETALAPRPFAALLDELPDPIIRVNYDSGNSSSLGYSPSDEFAAYGVRVGSVHIKDRLRGGGTVPLGTGHASFAELFDALAARQYRGDFILQAARGEPGDEVELARRNRAFVERAAGASA
jgi:hexulose-6-phosphate isomerase